MNDKIRIYDCEQGTQEWLKLRLGKFTSSKIGDLMGTGRNGSIFSKTGISYIYSIASERNIADWVKDEENLSFWFERTGVSSYAMKYGSENESFARDAYEEYFDLSVSQVGLVERKDIPFYADSPDGLVYGDDYLGALEIKCPYNPAIHLEYCSIDAPDKLLKIEPKYYWQCYSRLLITGADWCDFVSFDMYQKSDLHRLRLYPDKKAFNQILERIYLANKEVNRILGTPEEVKMKESMLKN